MKHSIDIIKTTQTSHWIKVPEKKIYSVSVRPIETESLEELVEAILMEFNQTSDELKPLLKEKLATWLNEMKDSDLELADTEKIRDFIYEMF